MYNLPKTDSPQPKSIFSCNVYKTHEQRVSLPPPLSFKLPSRQIRDPKVLFINENLLKRSKKTTKIKESSTQTSKTILQLAKIDCEDMSPDSLSNSPQKTDRLVYTLSNFTLEGSCQEHLDNLPFEKSLTQTFLEKNCFKTNPAEDLPNFFKSKSFIETYPHPNYIQERPLHIKPHPDKKNSRSLILTRELTSSFMHPTTASQIKSKMADIQSTNNLIPRMRQGRSMSPKPTNEKRWFETSRKIPYFDQSKSDVSSNTTLINTTRQPERLQELIKCDMALRLSIASLDKSTSSIDTSICLAVTKMRDSDWRVALRGLADIVEICRLVDVDLIWDYMSSINQKLIELLKSPRSHVCRTACQAAGNLFEYIKDTRRPEFDDIVDILLHKTADANKFIRHDANLALDCMVTHITSFNSVRALCSKGPHHKNPLVRCATVRLLVCTCVITGPDFILNPNSNEHTRKRIILNMARFLEDKNLDTRKMAERLYKVLCKEPRFDVYLKKYLSKDQIGKITKTLKLIHKK